MKRHGSGQGADSPRSIVKADRSGRALLGLWTAVRGRHLRGEFVPLRQALKVCAKALWGLFTRVIMLGGSLVGGFTANEGASIAALWDFIVTFCRPRS